MASESSETSSLTSTFDPSQAYITYTSLYGSGTQISFEELESLVQTRLTRGILFGTRIGAAGLAIIVLWMITKNRKTPIFIINQVSLSLLLMHSALYVGYLFSHYGSITYNLTMFSQYISRSNVYLYGATDIFQVLLVASIELSLSYQVRIIFKSDNFKGIGRVLVGCSAILAVATVVVYFLTAIKSMITIYSDVSGNSSVSLFNVSTILLSCSVNFMTLLLTTKLLLAIRSRRFLGLKQFDSFHILMIMSFQTLIFPSLLFILAYALNGNEGTDTLASVATLLVTLSLPLSSMWATTANNSSNPSSVNVQYSTSAYDSGSSHMDETSLYAQSMKSSVHSKRYQNQIYDLYPVSKEQKEHCRCGNEDLEKNELSTLSVPMNGLNINRKPCDNHSSRADRYDESGHDDSDANETSKDVVSLNVYTPNTLDDEEARKFWSGNDSSQKTQFIETGTLKYNRSISS